MRGRTGRVEATVRQFEPGIDIDVGDANVVADQGLLQLGTDKSLARSVDSGNADKHRPIARRLGADLQDSGNRGDEIGAAKRGRASFSFLASVHRQTLFSARDQPPVSNPGYSVMPPSTNSVMPCT